MKNRHLIAALWLLALAPAAAQTVLTFTPRAALPDGGRYGMAYCQDQTYLYMMGGGSPATAYTNDLYRYNPAADSWGAGPLSSGQVWQHRLGTAAIIAPNTPNAVIYTLNGATGTGPVLTVQPVRASDGVATGTPPNPTPASTAGLAAWNGLLYAEAAVFNNFLYVWGGNTAAWNASTLADMWRVDVSIVLATAGAAATAPVLRAHPNPCAAGRATLALPDGARTLEVFDARGRRVLAAAPAPGTATWPLDLSGQPAGLYLARVRTAKGGAATCRVVCE